MYAIGLGRDFSRSEQSVHPAQVFSDWALAGDRRDHGTVLVNGGEMIDEPVRTEVYAILPEPLSHGSAVRPEEIALSDDLHNLRLLFRHGDYFYMNHRAGAIQNILPIPSRYLVPED